MITLIVDGNNIGLNRQIFENLTLRELGEKLTELSEKYILVFDTVMNINVALGCDLFIVISGMRVQRF